MKKKSRWRRVVASSVLAIVLTGVVAWTLVPRIVRDRVEKKAEAMGLQVSIGSVKIRLRKVTLSEVNIQSHRFPGQKVKLDRVDVFLGSSLEVTRVEGNGGSVDLVGPWEDLREQFREWKRPGTAGGGRRKEIRVSGVSVTWTDPIEGAELKIEGASAVRGEKILAEAKSVRLTRGGASLDAKGVSWDGTDLVNVETLNVETTAYDETVIPAVSVASAKSRAGRILGFLPEGQASLHISSLSMSLAGQKFEASKADISIRRSEDVWVFVGASSATSPIAKSGTVSASIKAHVGKNSMEVDVMIEAMDVVTSHPSLVRDNIGIGNLGFEGSLHVGDGTIDLAEATLDVGSVRVEIDGSKDEDGVSGRVSLKMTSCQDIIDSIPKSRMKTVDGMKMSGDLGFEVLFDVDLPARESPKVNMSLKNECKVESVPEELLTSRLRKPFKYEVYSKNGEMKERTSGPGSPGWVPLGFVSKFVPVSVRTMEDPGFWAHRGFHVEAIENSIKENIRVGRFVRGASTISMQLAKNLWLQRERTAARKIQEALLTMWLEQSLTKEQILELYVNVIEFGPDVYGLKAGAHHYFRIHPVNMSLGQSLFLASILPKPKSYHFGADGKLFPRTAWRLRGIMKSMKEKMRISEDEYREGVTEVLVFRHPSTSMAVAEEDIPVSTGGIDPESWN